MSHLTDTEFETETIENVDAGEGGWTITTGLGCIWCAADQCATPPQIGERVKFFGRGFGYPVRGIVIADRVYRYRSEREDAEATAAYHLAEHARKVGEFNAARGDRDARTAKLPAPLAKRMRWFQKREDWRVTTEPYELMVCEDAAKVSTWASLAADGASAAIARLCDSQDLQKEVGMDQGHSGNSFGAAVTLAKLLIASPDLVWRMHGALCPLTGCADAGCYASRQEEGAQFEAVTS